MSALFALNIMVLTFDTYYLVPDTEIAENQDLDEFIKSDPGWTHDVVKGGYTKPRTPLYSAQAPVAA